MKRHWQGVVLVGGASRRMGRPKAGITRDGRTQGACLVSTLTQELKRPAWISGEGIAGVEAHRVADREAGAGPLSAILGLFDEQVQDYVVLASDLFAFDTAALTWLLEMGEQLAQPALWPLLPGRKFGEPLAALYRRDALPYLSASWHEGNRSMKRALPSEAVWMPEVPASLVQNFRGANTPQQLADFQGIDTSSVS